MTTARERYLQRILEERYGIVGRVAARYVGAGLHVRLMHPTRYGPVHIFAIGAGQRLVIEVCDKPGKVTEETINTLVNKAKLLRSKPVLVLYGKDVLLPEDLFKKAREMGVKVRRIIPS